MGIPCRKLNRHNSVGDFEGIFFEINLKKKKWLFFGEYNPEKENIANFLLNVASTLDHFLTNYDNLFLMGDFNSEPNEKELADFCETYNLSNLVKGPTCYKNPTNPSCIDLLFINRTGNYKQSIMVETGISDYHKLVVTVMKSFFKKAAPHIIKYRDYKTFDERLFRNELSENLADISDTELNYDVFENIFLKHINKYAPMKEKRVRANNSPFMNKILSKAVMKRSRLRNKYLKNPTEINKITYTKYRNYCVNLFKKEKRKYYGNLDPKLIIDNKTFWKTVKPLFSETKKDSRNIILIENEEIISNNKNVTNIMNDFFSKAVENLNIEGYSVEGISIDPHVDPISYATEKFRKHPSIVKIKESITIEEKFSFPETEIAEVKKEIHGRNVNKPTTLNNIPAKILVLTSDICSPVITKIYNKSKENCDFPNALKMADITPAHKKEETTNKENYRPVSILPSISKILEGNMYDNIYMYMDKYLSPYLCGFRRGYSAQHCLIHMLEQWNKAMDNKCYAGALLTDLSKAFDCINHELLIAKLEAYGFDKDSLKFILSYLTDRKHRTKLNNSLSPWANIYSGIPQASILGPLLFNIYINGLLLFVNGKNVANYADDNTPYAMNFRFDSLIENVENDASILITWFRDNYLKMNEGKCHLLITNQEEKRVSAIIGKETIENSKSVKLLGITIDNKLSFDTHVSTICKKVNLKLHALARISNLMSTSKLRIIMKSFIESQFGYCPLVWMFHSRTLNNKINKLRERALRLVYKEHNLSFEELLRKDNSVTTHHRNLQKLAIEMYKLINNITPTLMKTLFPESGNPYTLRSGNSFQTYNVRTVYNGTETLLFRGPKTWGMVPSHIKKSKSLKEFNSRIRNWTPEGCECRLCKVFVRNVGFI